MAFRSQTAVNQPTGDTATVTKPTGTASGDILLMVAVSANSTTETFTWPSGFTQGDTTATTGGGYTKSAAWAWKLAGGSEPASYDVVASSADNFAVCCVCYQDMDATPIDDNDKGNNDTPAASPLTMTPAGMVTTVANAIVMWAGIPSYQISNNNPAPGTTVITQPSGHTVRSTVMGDYAAITVSDITQASAGATGSLAGTAANDQGQDGTWCAFSIALQPAAGSATITPSVGALALTGLAASMAISGAADITPSVGALTLTGNAAVVTSSSTHTRTPSAGALTFTGLQPSQTLTVAAPITGALTLTGNAASVVRGTVMSPSVGALTLSGNAPTLAVPQTITPSLGALTLTGLQAAVSVGVPNTILIPQVGSLSFNGQPVTLIQSSPTVIPQAGSMSFSGLAPSISRNSYGSVNANVHFGFGFGF